MGDVSAGGVAVTGAGGGDGNGAGGVAVTGAGEDEGISLLQN